MKLLRFLYLFLIITIPLGQFGRLVFGGGVVVIYLNDLILSLAFIVLIFEIFVMRRKFQLPPLFFPILFFVLIAATTLLFAKKDLSFSEFAVSGLYLIRWILYAAIYIGIFFLLINSSDRQKEVRLFANLIILASLILGVFGLIQYVIFPDFSKIVETGWDPHYYRVLSTFFDPNFVGGFFIMSLNLILGLFIFDQEPKRKSYLNILYFVAAGIIFVAIILTFSRSTYLMLIVSLGIMGFLKSKKLLLVGILSLVLVYLLIPRVQERIYGAVVNIDGSASARFSSWENGIAVAKDNPLTGIGYNAYRYAQIRYGFIEPWKNDLGGHSGAGTDSSLLLILATTGIFGLISYLWFYLTVLVRSGANIFKPEKGIIKGLNLALLCIFSGLLFHSLFVNSLLYLWIMEFMWIVIALRDGLLIENKKVEFLSIINHSFTKKIQR